MTWINEPPKWSETDGVLTVLSAPGTDFWRETHYGYTRFSGHVLTHEAEGDFTASVRFRGDFKDLYDQAGLMLVVDEANWLKCGVEFTSGTLNVSSVLTRDFSDWSILPIATSAEPIGIRITRLGSTLMVDYSLDGEHFHVVRLGYLPMPERVRVGPMCCSPVGPGFETTFTDFAITSPARTDDQ
jgi:regulation of enolase protein 1 (concanavalin A-like superfamily)